MINYDEKDNRISIIDSIIKNNNGTKEEIQLYQQLSISLELMANNNFNVINSGIDDGLYFEIITKFPYALPDEISIMFFNIDINYSVSIKETSKYVYNLERHFLIKIKKRNN